MLVVVVTDVAQEVTEGEEGVRHMWVSGSIPEKKIQKIIDPIKL